MDIKICDLCEIVLGSKRYVMALKTIEEPSKELINATKDSSVKSIVESYQATLDNVRVIELCENCKKVIEKAIDRRKTRVRKLNNKFDNVIEGKQGK